MIQVKEAPEIQVSESAQDVACTHTLAIWSPPAPSFWRRQRIVSIRKCQSTPAATAVTESCGSCTFTKSGHWCAKCLQSLTHEYEHGPLFCLACSQFSIVLRLG